MQDNALVMTKGERRKRQAENEIEFISFNAQTIPSELRTCRCEANTARFLYDCKLTKKSGRL